MYHIAPNKGVTRTIHSDNVKSGRKYSIDIAHINTYKCNTELNDGLSQLGF